MIGDKRDEEKVERLDQLLTCSQSLKDRIKNAATKSKSSSNRDQLNTHLYRYGVLTMKVIG